MCMYKVLKPLEGSAFVRRLISCWLTPGSNMIQDQPGNGGGGGMRFLPNKRHSGAYCFGGCMRWCAVRVRIEESEGGG